VEYAKVLASITSIIGTSTAVLSSSMRERRGSIQFFGGFAVSIEEDEDVAGGDAGTLQAGTDQTHARF
jgi:hypothetical protein